MKKFILFAVSLFLLINVNAERYQTFASLATARPKYTHTINSFDANGVRGGGTFLWVTGSPAAVQNIYGLIQLSNIDATGYWVREDYLNNGIIYSSYFGANGRAITLQAQGITQPTANLIWGTNTVNVTIDTYDQASINYFNKLAVQFKLYNYVVAQPIFYFSSPTSVPHLPDGTGQKTKFRYDGNGCLATSISTTNFSFITDNYLSHSRMENYQTNRQFIFANWNFTGNATPAGSDDTCLNLYSSMQTIVQNCNFKNFQVGISLRHCLLYFIENVEVNQCKNIGIYIGCGTTADIPGPSGHEQSNMGTLNNIRLFSGGTYADIIFEGVSGTGINHIVFEGPSGGQYGLIFKNDVIGANHVKDFEANIFHIEKTYTKAAILVQAFGYPTIQFKNIFCQYANTMVDADGLAYIIIENMPYNTGTMKFGHRGSPGGWPMWSFKNVEPVNTPLLVNSIKHAQSWAVGGGLSLPTFAPDILVNASGNYAYELPFRQLTSANVFEEKAKFKQ